MNKRCLLNFAMCSLLLGSMPLAITSCKDYDDDINNLDSTTKDLNSQVASLKTALESANAAAAAANSAAAAAASKADSATAEAMAAKAAAEQAKADALEAALAEIEKLQGEMTSLNDETAKQIAALSGKIDGIEDGLANIDLKDIEDKLGAQVTSAISDVNKQIEAINVQIAALDNYKTALDNLNASSASQAAEITKIQADLKAAADKAAANAAAIEANKTAISTIQGDITKLNTQLGQLSQQITKDVNNQLNTLATLMSGRLTAVTLAPDLYVDGIPTIEFLTAKYNKLAWNAKTKKWQYATVKKNNQDVIAPEVDLTNDLAEAQYRLNPGTLKDDDIDIAGMRFVGKVAATRNDYPQNGVEVASAAIGNDGYLNVRLKKGTDKSLNATSNTGVDSIFTISLEVPIAEKHLFEGEEYASVYSEFTRISESTFTPRLRFVNGQFNNDGYGPQYPNVYNGKRYYFPISYPITSQDSTVLYNSDADYYQAKKLPYNETYDLNKLVQVCNNQTYDSINNATLARYGLEIRYAVATKAYTPSDRSSQDGTQDKTNQQDFAKIDGSILTPIAASGTTNNQNIIGKTPIIRAMLVDVTNGNVVEVSYFKVAFTANTTPVNITLNETTNTSSVCGSTYNFTWDYMAANVLEKLNEGKGMSKADFQKIYGDITPKVEYVKSAADKKLKPEDYFGEGLLTVSPANQWSWDPGTATPIMKWTADANTFGKVNFGMNTRELQAKVTFTSNQPIYPNVVLNVNWTINANLATMGLGAESPIIWNNNTMDVRVVPMTVNQTTGVPTNKATYATNILTGREDPFVTNLLSCTDYGIVYAGYEFQPYWQATKSKFVGNPLKYTAKQDSLNGAYSQYFTPLNNVNAGYVITKRNQGGLESVLYSLTPDTKTVNGKLVNGPADSLVNNGGTIRVAVQAKVNGLDMNNLYVGSLYLNVNKILNINPEAVAEVTDNSEAAPINLNNALRITDAYGNLVQNQSYDPAKAKMPQATAFWNFYGIGTDYNGTARKIVYDTAKATMSTSASGANAESLSKYNMTAVVDESGYLKFTNGGSVIQQDFYIFIPVQVPHIYGVVEGTMSLLVKANSK